MKDVLNLEKVQPEKFSNHLVEDNQYATGCEIPEEPYVGVRNQQITPDKLEQDFKAGKTMIVSTPKNQGGLFAGLGSPALEQYGLKENHCYTVKRVYTDDRGQKMVELFAVS